MYTDNLEISRRLGVTSLTVGSRISTNDAERKGYEHGQENKKYWQQEIFLEKKRKKIYWLALPVLKCSFQKSCKDHLLLIQEET